jgi:membrane protein implicated in regulation of membrane protease activity
MNNKTEGAFSIGAALLVLFSSMWNPQVAMVVAISALLIIGLYEFLKRKQK